MMATVSALRSPAHRWPHLTNSTDADGAAVQAGNAPQVQETGQDAPQ